VVSNSGKYIPLSIDDVVFENNAYILPATNVVLLECSEGRGRNKEIGNA